MSSAIVRENAEVTEAHRLHIPVIPRAEMLAELMRLKYGIAIAGMPGKTTTTSMVAAVLAAGGLDPTVVVGGRVDAMGSNARVGNSEYMVVEADESDRSFLKLSPVLAVVTNVDREHMDCYRNMREVKRAFLEFMDRVPFYGAVVVCNDDPQLRRLFPQIRRRTVSYGTRRGSDFHIKLGKAGFKSAVASEERQPTSHFRVTFGERDLGEFRLHVPGVHNVMNATAAIAVGVGLDIEVDDIRAALENFRGVDRRFQLRGQAAGVSVIDDYGHHPTEIRATLAAARECGFRKIHVIFQPHRYTRTRDLTDEFATSFENADSLVVLDIYAASETPIEGVTGESLARLIGQTGKSAASYAGSFADGVASVVAAAQPGDMILTLGAGSVSQLGPMILEKLRAKGA
jgi:UDP-N-acetylmuramate--alanine ligase